MTKALLEFVVSVEAEQSTIETLKEALCDAQSTLADRLVSLVQDQLSEAGVADEFKTELPKNRITIKTTFDGGLSAQEWLEKGNLVETTGDQTFPQTDFQD